jgi:RNA polymerase sigma-70 factor (family 1)
MKSTASLSESDLIDLLKSGDQAAFAEIYNRYWRLLVDAAYQRLKSLEAAEEAVQDVFVNFYIRRSTINLNSSLEAYLKTALKFKVYNLYRSQAVRYNYLSSLIGENYVDSASPDKALESKELKTQILSVMEKMPDKCKEVFLLSRFEHLSHQEIAERMNISVSTVKKHITKAKSIIRFEFKSYNTDFLIICIFIYTQNQHISIFS